MINISYVVKIDGKIQTKQFKVVAGHAQDLTPEMFLSRDEIVNDIVNDKLSENDKIYFKDASDLTLSLEHMGAGMWIRNAYGLWETEKNSLVNEHAYSSSHKHPDNLSHIILELVRDVLQDKNVIKESNKESNFDLAMKTIGNN